MTRFRPSLIPTLVTVPALLVLLGLGTWQVQRLAWKEALIAERQAQLAAPPVPLPEFTDPPAAGLLDRRFTVGGVLLHDKSLFYGVKVVEGRSGTELLTPLKLEDGRIVMVNRGWIPNNTLLSAKPARSLVEITGVLRPPGHGNWFTPDPDLKTGHWFSYNVATMARYLALPLQPAVLEAVAGAEPGRLPLARDPEVNLVNHHLQYALTWYALALALLVIYVLYHRKREV